MNVVFFSFFFLRIIQQRPAKTKQAVKLGSFCRQQFPTRKWKMPQYRLLLRNELSMPWSWFLFFPFFFFDWKNNKYSLKQWQEDLKKWKSCEQQKVGKWRIWATVKGLTYICLLYSQKPNRGCFFSNFTCSIQGSFLIWPRRSNQLGNLIIKNSKILSLIMYTLHFSC